MNTSQTAGGVRPRIIVGISGASGVVYGVHMLKQLRSQWSRTWLC